MKALLSWRRWRREPRAQPGPDEGSLVVLAALALAAGAGSGLIAALFRLALAWVEEWRGALIVHAHHQTFIGFVLVVLGCAAAVALAAGLVRRFSPYASGSGIPQVEGALIGDLPPAPPRLLPVKFIGGLLTIGAGMALGREGPSVQMGAVVASLFGKAGGREADADLARADSARAALIGTQAQVVAAQSLIDAQTAESERLKATIADNTLKSPIRARVQGRLAQPGEVVAEGGKVLSTLDLSDVYMYVFLPTDVTGKLALGADARIVLDALPGYPIKAVVSYIDPNAQFTPKQVETAAERHNLTFRVKLQIPNKEGLRQLERMVKVGVPGMGYVQIDPSAEWPKNLQLRPPSEWPKLPEIATGKTTNGAVPDKQ